MEVYVVEMGQFQENCYIVKKNHEVLIIDPGSKMNNVYNNGSISEIIEEDDVVLGILLTHGHFDHIGGVNELYEKYKCNVYLDKNDEKMSRNYRLNFSQFEPVKISSSITLKNYTFDDEFTIGDFHLKVIKTPGHTEGGVVIIIDDKYMFTGDTLFKGSIGRTDLYGGNYQKLKESLDRLKLMINNPDLVVCPGHGPASSWGEELRSNYYLK